MQDVRLRSGEKRCFEWLLGLEGKAIQITVQRSAASEQR